MTQTVITETAQRATKAATKARTERAKSPATKAREAVEVVRKRRAAVASAELAEATLDERLSTGDESVTALDIVTAPVEVERCRTLLGAAERALAAAVKAVPFEGEASTARALAAYLNRTTGLPAAGLTLVEAGDEFTPESMPFVLVTQAEPTSWDLGRARVSARVEVRYFAGAFHKPLNLRDVAEQMAGAYAGTLQVFGSRTVTDEDTKVTTTTTTVQVSDLEPDESTLPVIASESLDIAKRGGQGRVVNTETGHESTASVPTKVVVNAVNAALGGRTATGYASSKWVDAAQGSPTDAVLVDESTEGAETRTTWSVKVVTKRGTDEVVEAARSLIGRTPGMLHTLGRCEAVDLVAEDVTVNAAGTAWCDLNLRVEFVAEVVDSRADVTAWQNPDETFSVDA